MNKKIALFILAVGLILTGCQLNGVKEKTSSPETVNPSAVNVNHDLLQVTISRGHSFGQVNNKVYGVLEKPEEVEAFEEAIQTAEKQNGKMDIREPDYDAVIDWKGTRQSIHLWLEVDVDYGMFTYISDTGTGFKLTKESTIRLRDLIQGIRYEPELAKKNGDVVFAPQGVFNSNGWTAFLQNIESGQADSIQVTSYTIEGAPIFYNLDYDGQQIRYQFDNTHDNYGTPIKQVDFCKTVDSERTERGTAYKLTGCGENNSKESNTFSLLFLK